MQSTTSVHCLLALFFAEFISGQSLKPHRVWSFVRQQESVCTTTKEHEMCVTKIGPACLCQKHKLLQQTCAINCNIDEPIHPVDSTFKVSEGAKFARE